VLSSRAGAGQGAGGAAGCREAQLGFGEQGAEDLPVVLAERDRPVEVGGHALEFAEVVQAQAVVEALLDLAELRADHGGGPADGGLGGVDSPGGVLDGVRGGPVAALDELAELLVADAVVVHGFLLFTWQGARGVLRVRLLPRGARRRAASSPRGARAFKR
jgi:hypothetical protein